MRVTSAFNRMLRLPGASVIDVSFGAEGVIVTVRFAAAPACLLGLRAASTAGESSAGVTSISARAAA